MNEYEEGLPLFALHVVSVGSLRGLLVGLLLVRAHAFGLPLPGKASLGRGPSEMAGC